MPKLVPIRPRVIFIQRLAITVIGRTDASSRGGILPGGRLREQKYVYKHTWNMTRSPLNVSKIVFVLWQSN